jgi:peptide methionine sulfoxide reductase msrA/msrB
MIFTGCTNVKSNDKVISNTPNPFYKELVDINGTPDNLANYNGQKIVVKVWASWCSICLSGLEEYNELSKTYEDAVILSMVAPNKNNEMSADDFSEWFSALTEYQDITVLYDQEGTLLDSFNIRAYPSYVYVNTAGEVAHVAIGHQSNEQIITQLNEIS